MPTFSERVGVIQPRRAMQLEAMDDELRAALWNVLDFWVWQKGGVAAYKPQRESNHAQLFMNMWDALFRSPIDTIPHRYDATIAEIRNWFFSCEWNRAYDLAEFVVARNVALVKEFNRALTRDLSGYRFIGNLLVPVTSSNEIEAIEAALASTSMPGVQEHLKQALALLSDRKSPDFRNSMKESISAIEALAKYVTGEPKVTLGEALRPLEAAGLIHPAQKAAFSALYGYSSDASGIRHGMVDASNVTGADARWMLITCSAFINFMHSRISELGYKLPKLK
jgi:hypothetical protein